MINPIALNMAKEWLSFNRILAFLSARGLKVYYSWCNNRMLIGDSMQATVLPAKSDSDVIFCLQIIRGF